MADTPERETDKEVSMSDEVDTTEADMIAAMAEEEANKASEEEASEKATKASSKSSKSGKSSSKSLNPEAEKMERILDIPLVLSAQLGSSRMLVKELLQLGPGSVVELDKLAGEPLEVLVNDKLVARGEVVMVNDKFGVRLTDVVSPTERVQKLR